MKRTNKAPPIYDCIVIGSGPAGLAAVEKAVELRAGRIAVVERAPRLGGECPNTGCNPTKALLRSIEVLEEARHAREFGVVARGVKPDVTSMMRRKQTIIEASTGGQRLEKILHAWDVDLIRGDASFVAQDRIRVDGTEYRARAFVIATGSRIAVPAVTGIEHVPYYTFETLLGMKKPPRSIVILGGGPIGVEWAQILAPLGTAVTLVEVESHILPREEPEAASLVAHSLMDQGVTVITGVRMTDVRKKTRGIAMHIEKNADGSVKELRADALMIATGKKASFEGLGLERAGIVLDDRGVPKVNAYLQTSNSRVYIAGDASGQMMFTHVAHYQGGVAGENAIHGNVRKSDLRVVPRGTFCFPEVGSVGLTEREADQQKFDVVTGKALLGEVSKSILSGDSRGMVKIVVDRKSQLILGGHIVGTNAAELVHHIALAMHAKLPIGTLAKMMYAYPTYAEAIGLAAYRAEQASQVVGSR